MRRQISRDETFVPTFKVDSTCIPVNCTLHSICATYKPAAASRKTGLFVDWPFCAPGTGHLELVLHGMRHVHHEGSSAAPQHSPAGHLGEFPARRASNCHAVALGCTGQGITGGRGGVRAVLCCQRSQALNAWGRHPRACSLAWQHRSWSRRSDVQACCDASLCFHRDAAHCALHGSFCCGLPAMADAVPRLSALLPAHLPEDLNTSAGMPQGSVCVGAS
eukprot:scaffold108987_cov19-Tisochrysis_lutea.AAC.4